ncbi:MAG: cytidine deaminase [bacterium]
MNFDEKTLEGLLEIAKAASANSYSPFSHFPVGAAILTANHKIYSGCNVENSSFGLTICAERVAIFKAISEGEREFLALAIYSPVLSPPCGACLQVLSQFVSAPDDFLIISFDKEGKTKRWSLSQLLPFPFTF